MKKLDNNITTTKTVFDTSKLTVGREIEIIDDKKDLIRYNAILIRVELDEIEYMYVDPESKDLHTEKIFLYELSNETYDGYTINLL